MGGRRRRGWEHRGQSRPYPTARPTRPDEPNWRGGQSGCTQTDRPTQAQRTYVQEKGYRQQAGCVIVWKERNKPNGQHRGRPVNRVAWRVASAQAATAATSEKQHLPTQHARQQRNDEPPFKSGCLASEDAAHPYLGRKETATDVPCRARRPQRGVPFPPSRDPPSPAQRSTS